MRNRSRAAGIACSSRSMAVARARGRDGSQVFYRAPDGWMTAARVTHGATLAVTGRERLFDASPYLANQFLVMYDVAADGRFLMLKLDPQPARTDVILIRNWVQQVKARLGG